MKTALEILKTKTAFVSMNDAETVNIVEAMEAYASQFKPKWIKIESEADLPKKSEFVWFVLKGGALFSGIYSADFKVFKSHNTMTFLSSEVTHYAPIIKPEPPKKD